MTTPETDRVWAQHQGTTAEFFEAVVIHARRLELDRAALMEFLIRLEQMADDDEFGSSDFRKTCRYDIPKTLAAARANFPTS